MHARHSLLISVEFLYHQGAFPNASPEMWGGAPWVAPALGRRQETQEIRTNCFVMASCVVFPSVFKILSKYWCLISVPSSFGRVYIKCDLVRAFLQADRHQLTQGLRKRLDTKISTRHTINASILSNHILSPTSHTSPTTKEMCCSKKRARQAQAAAALAQGVPVASRTGCHSGKQNSCFRSLFPRKLGGKSQERYCNEKPVCVENSPIIQKIRKKP